jgi:hypothetical protein
MKSPTKKADIFPRIIAAWEQDKWLPSEGMVCPTEKSLVKNGFAPKVWVVLKDGRVMTRSTGDARYNWSNTVAWFPIEAYPEVPKGLANALKAAGDSRSSVINIPGQVLDHRSYFKGNGDLCVGCRTVSAKDVDKIVKVQATVRASVQAKKKAMEAAKAKLLANFG